MVDFAVSQIHYNDGQVIFLTSFTNHEGLNKYATTARWSYKKPSLPYYMNWTIQNLVIFVFLQFFHLSVMS